MCCTGFSVRDAHKHHTTPDVHFHTDPSVLIGRGLEVAASQLPKLCNHLLSSEPGEDWLLVSWDLVRHVRMHGEVWRTDSGWRTKWLALTPETLPERRVIYIYILEPI